MNAVIKFLEGENSLASNNINYPTNNQYKDFYIKNARARMIENIVNASKGLSSEVNSIEPILRLLENKGSFNQSFSNKVVEMINENLSGKVSNISNILELTVKDPKKIEESVEQQEFSEILQQTFALVAAVYGKSEDKNGNLQILKSISSWENVNSSAAALFFKHLGLFLSEKGSELDQTIANCKNIEKLLKGEKNPKNGASIASSIYGSLTQIVAECLFEQIVAIAKKEVAEKDTELRDAIESTFKRSGLTVISGWKQTGSEKGLNNSNKKQVSDSYLSVIVQEQGSYAIAEIRLFDSTKMITGKGNYKIHPTEEQINQTDFHLGRQLREVGVYEYWKARLQPFLVSNTRKGNASRDMISSEDWSNWADTRARILVKHAYDTIAVRAGGPNATTLTVGQTSRSVLAVIEKYWSWLDNSGGRARNRGFYLENEDGKKNGANIFSLYRKGYIKEQRGISSGGSVKDEILLSKNAMTLWHNTLNRVKMDMSINVSALFAGF